MQAACATGMCRQPGAIVVEFPEIPNEMTAAARAQWLAELSHALDKAQKMIAGLGVGPGNPAAMELYVRIEAARLEVRALRLRGGRISADQIDPKWTEQLPWKRNGTDF